MNPRANPLFLHYGPAAGSCNGYHPKSSKFLGAVTKKQIRFHLPLVAVLTLAAAPALHAQIAPGELVAPKLEISGGNLNFTIQPSVVGRNYWLQCSVSRAVYKTGQGDAVVCNWSANGYRAYTSPGNADYYSGFRPARGAP
jgi:hypothetical protein